MLQTQCGGQRLRGKLAAHAAARSLLYAICGSGLFLFAGCDEQDDKPVAVSEAAKSLRLQLGRKGAATETAASTGPTGVATLQGVFRMVGDPPPRQPLPVVKDVEVCAPGGKQVLSEEVLVDPASRGLANLVIFVRELPLDVQNKIDEELAAKPPPDVVFDQKACLFLTHVLPVVVQHQKVILKNSDSVPHNTKAEGTPVNNVVAPGAEQVARFREEAPSPIFTKCDYHPWMAAYIFPRSNQFVAVTAVDGKFTIPNVPSGIELEFQVWHEKTKSKLTQVKVDDQPQKWAEGRFKLTLNKGETRNLTVDVDAALFK